LVPADAQPFVHYSFSFYRYLDPPTLYEETDADGVSIIIWQGPESSDEIIHGRTHLV